MTSRCKLSGGLLPLFNAVGMACKCCMQAAYNFSIHTSPTSCHKQLWASVDPDIKSARHTAFTGRTATGVYKSIH